MSTEQIAKILIFDAHNNIEEAREFLETMSKDDLVELYTTLVRANFNFSRSTIGDLINDALSKF